MPVSKLTKATQRLREFIRAGLPIDDALRRVVAGFGLTPEETKKLRDEETKKHE